jgi:hypothetical protein
VLSDAQKALLPHADDFDEVLAVKWDAWKAFVGMLEQAKHPLAANLGPYSGLHLPGRLDPDKVAQGFMAASAAPSRLLALNKSLLSLTLSARQMGREWPLRAVSSRTHIRERLKAAFGAEHGFRVEFAGPVAAREVVASEGESRFVLRHAGRTVTRSDWSVETHGTPVEELEGEAKTPLAAEAGRAVRETTVEVFVARRH